MACFLVLWLESPGFSSRLCSSLLQDCLSYSSKEQGKKRQSNTKTKKGFSPLSLTQRGPLPFLVHIPEKDLSKSSVCVQFRVSGSFWGHPRRYQEKKETNSWICQWCFEFWLPSPIHLTFTFQSPQLLHAFCPGFLDAFSESRVCLLHLDGNKNPPALILSLLINSATILFLT